jgi:uncharacterized membrane protein YdjX (TVP38/TMEM64 family)
MSPRARLAAFAALVVGALVLAVALGLGERLADLRDLIDDLGALGPLVFIAVYVVAVVAAVPASLLTVAAGALFGAVLGSAVVVVAATVGACIAFLIARRFARDAAADWLGGHPGAARVEGLVAEHGAGAVALTRLVPVIPFSLLNYAFGLTRVPFPTYALWTAICIVPGTVLYVVGGDAVGTGLAEGMVPVALVVALAAAAAALAGLVVYARRRLRRREPEPPPSL